MVVVAALVLSACGGRLVPEPRAPSDAGFACAETFDCHVDAIARRDGECSVQAGDRRGTCESGELCIRATMRACIVDEVDPVCSGDTVLVTGPDFRLCGDPAITCSDGECVGPGFD